MKSLTEMYKDLSRDAQERSKNIQRILHSLKCGVYYSRQERKTALERVNRLRNENVSSRSHRRHMSLAIAFLRNKEFLKVDAGKQPVDRDKIAELVMLEVRRKDSLFVREYIERWLRTSECTLSSLRDEVFSNDTELRIVREALDKSKQSIEDARVRIGIRQRRINRILSDLQKERAHLSDLHNSYDALRKNYEDMYASLSEEKRKKLVK